MFAENRLSNLIRTKRLSILKTGPSINDDTSEGKRGEIYGDLHKVTGVTRDARVVKKLGTWMTSFMDAP